MAELLAAVAIAAVLAAAHYLFWSRFLRVPSREDSLLFASTRDGWRLSVGRRMPRAAPRRPPVLLCHGIAANRGALDFGIERYSLAAHLAAAGFRCFAPDLRGHGASRRGRDAPRRWNFDTYLRDDVPAILDAIRRETGEDRVLWVGHSQGGLLGMAACEAYPERVAGLVAMASPAHFDTQEDLKRLLRWFVLANGRWNRFLTRSFAPFTGVWKPPVGELAINSENVERPVYRRVLANVVENISPGVLDQFAVWIRTDCFCAADGGLDYRARLAECRQPALFIAADRDGLAPPAVVRSAHARWGGEKEYWSAGADYGHTDLLYGRRAPEEVFPRIRDWLLAHSEVAEDER